MLGSGLRGRLVQARPWMILAGVAAVAVWHLLDYSEVRDTDFPKVVRPFFNPWPPAAYRLAEPGDTLDRLGLYFASAASALSLMAIFGKLRAGIRDLALWPAALALSLAATWHASTPNPTFDGWHGLGWRSMLDPATPIGQRLAIALAAMVLVTTVLFNLTSSGTGLLWGAHRGASSLGEAHRPNHGGPRQGSTPPYSERLRKARDQGLRGLLGFATACILLRQVEVPGLGPPGYWPRAAFDLGLLAFVLALARARPFDTPSHWTRRGLTFAASFAAFAIAGILVSGHHRPIARLHAVVPGRIYIGAMPSYRGLAIEQERLQFKTIINLFDESSTQASPYHDDEIRFVREHGLRYLGSPSDGLESDRFLDETFALAQNPDAWPILVHCHGCMDRSPAWMGLYRFLIEGKPLAESFAEIERHRGSRPKSIVSLQYNRKLTTRAPERFETDPTCQLLKRCVAGTKDPFLKPGWNPYATGRKVVTRIEPDPTTRRP